MKKKLISLMLVFSVFFSFGIASAYAEGTTKTEQVQQVKHLHKSQTDKVIGGVCGGIAEYLGIDVIFVRAGFIFGALCGAGEVAYIILWVVMPSA